MHCVLTHNYLIFYPRILIGVSCDASDVGIGALRYSDKTKRPIANASKTLADTQHHYSQVQKKA